MVVWIFANGFVILGDGDDNDSWILPPRKIQFGVNSNRVFSALTTLWLYECLSLALEVVFVQSLQVHLFDI